MATKKKKAKAKKATHKKPRKLSKKAAPKKKLKKKKASSKKAAAKKKAPARKRAPKKTPAKKLVTRKAPASQKAAPRRRSTPDDENVGTAPFVREGLKARSGGQSGDLQGLSNLEGADSESVDELIEEGNSFEASIVKGVEDAGDDGEVHTHEVPEDDVPDEYLDKD